MHSEFSMRNFSTDSIAIAILNENKIIASEGNCIKVIGESCLNNKSFPVLKANVHGIVVGHEQLLLIYGEREFKLLDLDDSQSSIYSAKITDWISAACFLSESREFVLLTAHSVLLHYKQLSGKWQLAERFSCSDKSTLYCAHLHGNSLEKLVVFAGNAFGELLIWQPCKKEEQLQRFSAHNGVIFSIDFDEQTKLLITTSDDRSIRFWRLQEKKCSQIATGYAHTARVFCGKIIAYNDEKYAVTVGEDSFVCLWRTNGVLVHKCRQQFGATIWNFAYCKTTKILYTVGSTGNVLPLNLNGILEKTAVSKLLMPSLLDTTEYVAKVKFMNEVMLVGLTNKNKLLYYKLDSLEETWKTCNDNLENEKCTVLEIFKNYVILCGYQRLVIYKLENDQFTFPKIVSLPSLASVVRSLQILNECHALISDDSGNCLFLEHFFSSQLKHIEIDLPKSKERFVTASLLIPKIGKENEMDFLLASNRQGNLLLYARTAADKFELVDIFKHPHGNLGATVLKMKLNNADKALVVTAGRDGATNLFCIEKETRKLIFYMRQKIPVAWVEYMVNENVYFGFNDNHFVAWSSEQDFLAEIPCGGGHRSWHYYLEENLQKVQLAFIQNRRVHLETLNLYAKYQTHLKMPKRSKWHVKACNIARLDLQHFVSAGEDNLIKIFDLSEAGLEQKLEIDTHISNVRALKVVRRDLSNLLVFSGGGRAQLCVHELDLQYKTVKVLLNYTIKSETEERNEKQQQQMYSFDPETRIMALDIVELDERKNWHIFLGCSDGYLRKLIVDKESYEVKHSSSLFLERCILQTRLINDNIVVVANTDGFLHFYDLELKQELRAPLSHHGSGVNALDLAVLNDFVHILTGGDDQSVSYSCLKLQDLSIFKQFKIPFLHTAQVTAVAISKCCQFAFTCGVDQKFVHMNLETGAALKETKTVVADVKGLCLSTEPRKSIVYGCGVEILNNQIE